MELADLQEYQDANAIQIDGNQQDNAQRVNVRMLIYIAGVSLKY
jgi:hypothetical protein